MFLVDWMIVNMLAIKQGSLGHIRYVLKSDLKWIPLYGFYFEQVKKNQRKNVKIYYF
jgi:lysophosphatidate acyltransferase